jgi:hypothetical protein
LVTCRDDDGDEGVWFRQIVDNAVPFLIFGTGDHRGSYIDTLQMIGDRAACCAWRIRLRFGYGRHAAFSHAPVIKYARDMLDLGRFQFFSVA